MQLASRLRLTSLGDLLAVLHRESASGVLELIEPHARHAVHLRRGLVQAVETDAASRLGDVAARTYRVPRPLVERARMLALSRGIRIGQALVATQAIRPTDLDGLLAEQQRQRLERLFAIPDADVRFRVSRPLPPGASDRTPLEPRDVFHGRPRRQARTSCRAAKLQHAAEPSDGPTPHDVLGLAADAELHDVRAAFKKLVMELHPDRAHAEEERVQTERARRLVAVIDAYRKIAG